jgi:hypothetical protein
MQKAMKQGVVAGFIACGIVAAGGCLDRPVDNLAPDLGTTFGTSVTSKVIDKIDILFDIDNSASMGDKQDYLKTAIPDLVDRLLNPTCVDAAGTEQNASVNGVCPSGQKPEFAPVHDLHLGIVSSSLGMRGGDVCGPTLAAQPPFGNVLAHNDDHAYLLSRTLTYDDAGTGVTEGTLADVSQADPFLYWFPAASNPDDEAGVGVPIGDAGAFVTDFTNLVAGTGVFGCGIESQLETWYRFLVQPDPYASIAVDGGAAAWTGLDTTILQQRHDFLRPDSLVLIVVLSDEDDSEIDVRSLGGQAYHWMQSTFPLPRGTSACSDPASPSCQSCAQGNNDATDPTCMATPTYTQPNDWGFDINLRHVHMKAKYGVDPQYPIERYVTGLTSTVVPDRFGEYPAGATSYVGTTDCQNPLFAASLPGAGQTDPDSLCHAPPGTRTKDLVFYAHVGGVPNQLLHFAAGNPKASALTTGDWTKILGNDPEHYDYTGIDPHMIESYAPRPTLPPPGSPAGTDPISGHEWVTNTSNGQPGNMNGGHVLAVDREYACTFPLVGSNGASSPRDCTEAQNHDFCDCPSTPGSVTAAELPPICDTTTQTLQTGAKAYPTIRELLLAKDMGAQGIVSSICPIHVADTTGNDPYYGYRPAVAVIIDRLKAALNDTCLPQPLIALPGGGVSCLVLVQIPDGQAGVSGSCQSPTCPASAGLTAPSQDVLGRYCQGLEDTYNQEVADNGGSTHGLTDPANVPVCALRQLTIANFPNDFPSGSCATETSDKGWCYLTGTAAGSCAQAVVFSNGALPNGSSAQLQCDEHSVTVFGDGGSGASNTANGD